MRLSQEKITELCEKYYIENAVSELLGMQDYLDKVVPLRTLVEVGVCFGGSMHLWEQLLPPGDGMIIGVEINPSILDLLTGVIEESKTGKRNDWVVEWERGNVIKLVSNRQVYIVRGDSCSPETVQTLRSVLGDRNIDFWFHDGAHYGPVPVYDYYSHQDLIRSDGLVCVADTNNLNNPSEIVENSGCQALALELPQPKDLTVPGHRQGMVMWRKQDLWKMDPAAIVRKHSLHTLPNHTDPASYYSENVVP